MKDGARILDAGCGSGVVTRYLGEQNPHAQVMGCDLSPDRIEMAKKAVGDLRNVSFTNASIAQTTFAENNFDIVISRYVFQHLTPELAKQALAEFKRILKPKGKLFLIDGDGLFVNLYPQSATVANGIAKMSESKMVDFSVGRKLPSLMDSAGFSQLEWRLLTANHQGDSREDEVQLMRERFQAAHAQLSQILGDKGAREFAEAYLRDLGSSASTYFTETFVVKGTKPVESRLRLVKP